MDHMTELEFEEVPFTFSGHTADCSWRGKAVFELDDEVPLLSSFTFDTASGPFTVERFAARHNPDLGMLWAGLADNIMACCRLQLSDWVDTLPRSDQFEGCRHQMRELV